MSSFSEEKSKEFFNAARYGNLPLVKSLSVDPEINLNWQNEDDETPFYDACESGHVDIVCYLLDFHDNHPRKPIDYNLACSSGWTPFFTACFYGRVGVVEMLLEDDRIDVNRANIDEQTPLWRASWNGELGVVKRMLASTREIDVLKKDGDVKKTAAEIARERGEETERIYWEPEKYFQQRKARCPLVATLIEAYQEDPEWVRKQLRRELGIDARLAGELFALVVYLSDGYLVIHPERQG